MKWLDYLTPMYRSSLWKTWAPKIFLRRLLICKYFHFQVQDSDLYFHQISTNYLSDEVF